jgi:hypothetical protein
MLFGVCFLYLIFVPLSPALAMPPPSPPVVTLSVENRDSESVLLKVDVQTFGNTINSGSIKYQIGNSDEVLSKPIFLGVGFPVSVRLTNLPSDTKIRYWCQINYGSSKTVITEPEETRTLPRPTISVAKKSYYDGIKLSVSIQVNGHTATRRWLRVSSSGPSYTIELDASNQIADGAYEVKFPMQGTLSYTAYLEYQAAGETRQIETSPANAGTTMKPGFAVDPVSTDAESVTVEVYYMPYGNVVLDWWVEYTTPTNPQIRKVSASNIGPMTYQALLPDIAPDTAVSIKAVMLLEGINGPVTYDSLIKEARTHRLPQLVIDVTQVDLTSMTLALTVVANDNTLTASGFEYRLPGSSTWTRLAVPPSGTYSCVLTGLVSGSSVRCRGTFSYETTGGVRSLVTAEEQKWLYQVTTRPDFFTWQYFKDKQTGHLGVQGTVIAYQTSSSAVSHLDKGFVWSEQTKPVLGGGHKQISLGNADTPPEGEKIGAKLLDLVVGKTYYYRAYLILENGVVVYGSVVRFVTFMTDVGLYIPVVSPGAVIYPTGSATPTGSAMMTDETTMISGTPAQTPHASPTGTVNSSQIGQTTPAHTEPTSNQPGTGPADTQMTTGLLPVVDPDQTSPDRLWFWLAVAGAFVLGFTGSWLAVKARSKTKQQHEQRD